jgi:lipopolysaccharide export system protein LptA
MNRAGFALLTFIILAPGGAVLAAGLALDNHDTDKPVTINADAQDFDLKAKTVTYKGNVIAVQGDIRLHAETMKADQTANKIYADGKVVVDSPTSGTATGDNGIYDLSNKLVTLSGHVVLNKAGQATMRGSLLVVNMITGKAQLTARPVGATANQAAAPGLPGGRVQGVFTPKSANGGANNGAGNSGN